MDGAVSMMEAFTAIAQMLGGGAALLTGLRMDRTRKLERLLDKIAGDRDNIPLDEAVCCRRASMPQRAAPWWKVLFPHGYLVLRCRCPYLGKSSRLPIL